MGNNFQAPDLDDVKESVRQGVTKVAGKLSSLANGVMSSIQVRNYRTVKLASHFLSLPDIRANILL